MTYFTNARIAAPNTAITTSISIVAVLAVHLLSAGVARADDRITVSGSGETLTVTNGGGGADAAWVHSFSPDALLGVGGDYQSIADAHWAYGTLTGAYLWGEAGARWSVYGEAHIGSGFNGKRNFDYDDGSVGLSIPVYPKFTLQIEDRQLSIDTARGNMPKAQLSYLFNTHLQASASYAKSVGGDLGTDITTGRIDYYQRSMHYIAGAAFGTVDPLVLNLATADQPPAQTLSEGFIGAGHTSTRWEWLLLGDFQRLSTRVSASERFTVTLAYTYFLNGPVRTAAPK